MRFSIDRTELAQAAAISLVNIAALALLGLAGGYWTWQWFAPRTEPLSASQPELANQIASALELFGNTPGERNLPASTGSAIRLLGVVAAVEGRDAYAIVVLDGKQIIAARRGEDIVPGTRLAEVATDHIEFERDGVRESVALPEKTQAAGNAPQRPNQ